MVEFTKATKARRRARIAITGPGGSGKTYSALQIAKGFGGKIAVLDTERGSASLYSSEVPFDCVEITSYEVRKYIEVINAAAEAGYTTLIIDSLSHAWSGTGGILDQKDKKGGDFSAWRTLTPEQNKLIDAILDYPGHVIATMRSKTEYVVEKNDKGKSAPRKVGLAPVQRDGVEYEFDVVGDMDMDNTFHVSKTRCSAIAGQSIRCPGVELSKTLLAWLNDGTDKPKRVEAAPATAATTPVRSPAQLSDSASEAELIAWCASNAAHIAKADAPKREKARARIVETATRLECDPFVALEAAGLAIAEEGAA
jgi:hypothetical protein